MTYKTHNFVSTFQANDGLSPFVEANCMASNGGTYVYMTQSLLMCNKNKRKNIIENIYLPSNFFFTICLLFPIVNYIKHVFHLYSYCRTFSNNLHKNMLD